ncbi:MAG TPA: phosphatidate cytidylyltransferase [Actinomycetota bacterium]|jgi:phosphatidate cytidylyltransferase|nr:phosphatidate cytidylyltransferase [Actinomycetota bacterium]
MVPEGEERGGKFEDLFEDLDKFFAQNNPGASRRDSRAGEARDEGAGGSDQPEDLLPPGWEPDIEGLHLGSDPTPPTEEGAVSRVDAAGGPDPENRNRPGDSSEAEPEGAPGGSSSDEATGEMTGDDWSRLRDALGNESQREEPDRSEQRSTTETEQDLFGSEADDDNADAIALETGPAREQRHELSLEDLKKAPPEYEELPRAEEEPAEDLVGSVGDEEGARPEGGEEEGLVAEVPAPEEPYWDEPNMADVEAAADNLAASFGGGPEPDRVEEELLADIEEEPEGPRTVRVGGTEPLTGPTWEEPTSRPVMPDQGGAPEPARNLPAAVLTAAILAAVALISLAVAKAAFAVIAGGVVLLGQAELYATMQRKGHQPATALGLVIGGFTLAGAYLKGEQAMAFFVVLGLMLSFLWYMAAVPKAREGALAHIGSTLLGVLYVPFLAGFILVILAQSESGRSLMLAVLGLTFVYDIVAFLVGSLWGSRALAPTISPKKSWEGLLGASMVTFLLSLAILPTIDPLNPVKAVGLGLVVIVFAPLGDLAESAIKRDLGVKDMGSILPGHGGVLDRIDSVLFVAPAAFYFLRLIF